MFQYVLESKNINTLPDCILYLKVITRFATGIETNYPTV